MPTVDLRLSLNASTRSKICSEMQIGESLVISIFEHVMSLKTIFHVISKHSQQTTWPYQTLEATSESRTPYIFTYQSHNSNRSPKFHTAITPLTSLILLVESGRKQMSRYFGLAKQSHLIIVKVQRLVYLSLIERAFGLHGVTSQATAPLRLSFVSLISTSN